jgi:F0F1-type ATP synthase assembly protein I
VNNTVGAGNRLVLRVVTLQVGSAVLVGVLFGVLAGGAAALAGFVGGAIVAVGSALLGWRMFSPGVAPARALQRALFAGEALKWLWYGVAIATALGLLHLKGLPLLVGLIVAQFGYWIGLLGWKRG